MLRWRVISRRSFMAPYAAPTAAAAPIKAPATGLRLREEQKMAAAIPPASARPSSGPAAVRLGVMGSLSATSSAAKKNVAVRAKGGLAMAAGAAILRMPDNAPKTAAWAYTPEFVIH